MLVGANAQGKSNLLEAIAMLATGKSFRTSRENELIHFGQALASVVGTAHVASGTLNLACTLAAGVAGTRKTYTINGEGVRYARFLGSLKAVTFVPADLALVSGSPDARRKMVNEALSLADPRYYHELARYRKAMLQKNALLRGASAYVDTGLLDVYDGIMVESGTQLILARRRYLATLGEAAAGVYGHWALGERFEVQYVPNVSFDEPLDGAIAGNFAARLREQRPAEVTRKRCLVGPHRDEIAFLLDGTALARFGSQGQQRTAVLALKVAEYAVLRDLAGEAPLLLLDDVLSELDPRRADAFLGGLGHIEQAFVTATQAPDALRRAATAWQVENATLTRC